MSDWVTKPEIRQTRFKAEIYRPDGNWEVGGLAKLMAIMLPGSVILGSCVGYFTSRVFDIFIIGPLMVGGTLGALGDFGVSLGKIRNTILCVIIAIVCGSVAFTSGHYCNYRLFENQFSDVPEFIREVARNYSAFQAAKEGQTEEVQEIVAELSKEPEILKALALNGFIDYMKFRSQQGLVIVGQRKGGGNTREEYSSTANLAYLAFELISYIGITSLFMIGKSREPFCELCDKWKTPAGSSMIVGEAKKIRISLEAGDLSFLNADLNMASPDLLTLGLLRCPDRQCEHGFEVKLTAHYDAHMVGDKMKAKKNWHLSTVSYPPESLALFQGQIRPEKEVRLEQSADLGPELTSSRPPLKQEQAVAEYYHRQDQQLGGELVVYGWVVMSMAMIIMLCAVAFSISERAIATFGFGIGSVVLLCGWGFAGQAGARAEDYRHYNSY